MAMAKLRMARACISRLLNEDDECSAKEEYLRRIC
jgi:hypothetical protein